MPGLLVHAASLPTQKQSGSAVQRRDAIPSCASFPSTQPVSVHSPPAAPSSVHLDGASPIATNADIDSDVVDDKTDWDDYAARIAWSSQQHIARLVSTIKSQQSEIARLRARLQASSCATSATPITRAVSDSAATASRHSASEQQRTVRYVVPAAERASDASERTGGSKRGRAEMEDAGGGDRSYSSSKKRTQQASVVTDTSEADTAAAAESLNSEHITQPLPTLVVNILPPSPVKAVDTSSASPALHRSTHVLDTQPIEHDTHLPSSHHHHMHQQQQQRQHEQGGLTAADRLFDELTEQEAADAETRRKRLQAQSIARDAFNSMKQQDYSTAIQLLTQSLATLPLSAYPPSFLRARLTCYAKLGRRREMAVDAETMWAVWPGSVSAFMRGTVECRGRRYQQAVAWLREAEWRKREENNRDAERAAERQASGGVDNEEAEDVWAVTAEEREMRVVSLQSIRDSLSKVEQRIASETHAKAAAEVTKQEELKQQQQQQEMARADNERKDSGVQQDELRVTVVTEQGKGGKRVTFVAPPSHPSEAMPAVQ